MHLYIRVPTPLLTYARERVNTAPLLYSQATFARWHRGVSPRLPSSFKGNTSRLASSFVYSTIFRKTPPISILLVSGKITLAALLTLQLSSEGADEGKGS